MGLITKEVEVVLNSKNISYYESLGYEIPRYYNRQLKKMQVKRGTKILVKISDVLSGSEILVNVECDNCNRHYDIMMKQYSKCNHEGKIYCKHCATTVLLSGENSPHWKSDITMEERNSRMRNCTEYNDMVKRVIARDKHTCQRCGKICNHDAEVHHLDGYSWCKEKRYDDTNCVTLCEECHKNFHLIYTKNNNTKEQYEEWIGLPISLSIYNGTIITARQLYCYEEKKIYNSAKEFCIENNYKSDASIYRCCDLSNDKILTVNGFHLFWLDEYEKLSYEQIIEIIEKSKNKGTRRKIICVTTGVIYNSIVEGAIFYKCNQKGIGLVCNGKRKSAGKLPDGTPLQWMYYEDFLKLPIEEQNEILSRNQESLADDSFIM